MRKKTRLKGMTLMEIIIALAIYAVIAMLIVNIMTGVNQVIRVTNNLNKRLSFEAKYADNRIVDGAVVKNLTDEGTGKNTKLKIKFSGTTLDAKGSLYQVNYDKEDSTANDTHYRFMIFKETIAENDFRIPFTVAIDTSKIDKSKYKDLKIEAFEMIQRDTGWVQGTRLSTIDFPIETEVGKDQWIQKADGTGLDKVDKPAADAPAEDKLIKNQDAVIEGPDSDIWLIRTTRNPEDATDGYKRIQVIIYADLTGSGLFGESITDIDGKDITKFDILTFNIRFCAWSKNAEGRVVGWFDDTGMKYEIQSDLTIQRNAYSYPKQGTTSFPFIERVTT